LFFLSLPSPLFSGEPWKERERERERCIRGADKDEGETKTKDDGR